MLFINLPRRYFFFLREHRTDLPGLEHPRRYVPLWMNSFSRPLGLGRRLLIPQTGVAQAHYCHTVMGRGGLTYKFPSDVICVPFPERTLEARIDHSEECDLWVFFVFSLSLSLFTLWCAILQSLVAGPFVGVPVSEMWCRLRYDPVLYNNITVIWLLWGSETLPVPRYLTPRSRLQAVSLIKTLFPLFLA